jgi:hypothetical protein
MQNKQNFYCFLFLSILTIWSVVLCSYIFFGCVEAEVDIDQICVEKDITLNMFDKQNLIIDGCLTSEGVVEVCTKICLYNIDTTCIDSCRNSSNICPKPDQLITTIKNISSSDEINYKLYSQ